MDAAKARRPDVAPEADRREPMQTYQAGSPSGRAVPSVRRQPRPRLSLRSRAVVIAGFAVLLAQFGHAQSIESPRQAIDVVVYDYANVPAGELRRAKEELIAI